MVGFTRLTANALVTSLETVSGSVEYSGSPGKFDAESVSGRIQASVEQVQGNIDMDAISGAVLLQLPVQADITLRALDTIKEVEILLAEDTRVTKKLLEHYGIQANLESLHDFNEVQKIPTLIKILSSGANIGLVSDYFQLNLNQ